MSKENLKPILIMLAVIFVCAMLTRYLSGGETLADYASKNPDKAYGNTVTVTDGNSQQ